MPVELGQKRPPRNVWRAIVDGLRQRCPACGKGSLFWRYLKVRDVCPSCGEALHHHRADDAPAYFTIMIVGHVIVGAILPVERAFAPPLWLHAALWLPLTLGMSLWLLPRIKGAIVGLQWGFYMHGFEEAARGEAAATLPDRGLRPAVHSVSRTSKPPGASSPSSRISTAVTTAPRGP